MTPTKIKVGPLVLHDGRRQASWAGTPVPQLSDTLWIILRFLAHRPGWMRSRDEILDVLADRGERNDRTVDSQIKRIRRKLEAAGAPKDIIQTVYRSGYRLRDDMGDSV